MVKKVLCLVLAIFITVSFIACGSGNQSTQTTTQNNSQGTQEQSPTTKAKPAPQKITLAHNQGDWAQPIMEELARYYNEVSGNTLELIYIPADNITEWSKTQFLGGTEPDLIMNASQPASEYYKNKWIIDLKPYYEGISPYTGKVWQDSFREGILQGVVDANMGNAMVGMPGSVMPVNLYYNKDIFKELGLPDEPPKSWSEVLEIAKKVKESGKDIVPYSVQNSISWNLGWQEYWMMEELWRDAVEKLDIITPNERLDVAEQALGVKTGIIDPADERMVDYFRFMKEFAQYFNKGFNTASWEYEALFNDGNAAMNLNGAWYPNQHLVEKYKVNYGTGPLPYVDSKITKYTENRLKMYTIGQGSASYVVTQKCANEGRADAAVDFLQFLTDPATGAKFMAEKFMFVPVVKDVEVPEVLKGITDYIGTDKPGVGWSVFKFTPEQNDKYNVMFAAFLVDDTTPEEMAKKFKDLVLPACDKAIKDHPEWKVEEYLDKVQK